MDTSPASKKCAPCKKKDLRLNEAQIQKLFKQLGGKWSIVNKNQLENTYTFSDFAKALAFTNKVGAIAEKEGHHPDIYLSWGKVKITLSTHDIEGLSENDFILAAKCDLHTPLS